MRAMNRDLDVHVSAKWDSEKMEKFEDQIIQMKANGNLDRSVTKSEFIRRILENWTENPDREMLE